MMSNNIEHLSNFLQHLNVQPGKYPEGFSDLRDGNSAEANLSKELFQYSIRLESSQSALKEVQLRLEELFHNTRSPLFFVKKSGENFNIESLNYACEQMFGLHHSHTGSSDLLVLAEQRLTPICQDSFRKGLTIGREMTWQNGDEIRHFIIQIMPIRSKDDQVTVFAGVAHDLTDTKEYEQKTYRLAYFDETTDLPNRFHLNQSFTSLQNEGETPPLVFFLLDLDRFQQINDALGHEAGDLLLSQYAVRLRQNFSDPHYHIFRLGGDEFLIMHVIQPYTSIDSIAQKILDTFRQPMTLSAQEYTFTCSLGVSISPEHSMDLRVLLKFADIALSEAKRLGKNCAHYFTHEINERLQKRDAIEKALRMAVTHNELYMVLQPQIRLADGVCVGAEALIRWQHPQWGLLSPVEFIPIAEETGLILPIGRWVIEESCRQASELNKMGKPLRIAINLSTRQFADPYLVQTVKQSLEANDLPPELIELEITESILMDDIGRAQETLNELKELGVTLALDDFGTGYSSFAYLRQFPLHSLKIDRSFIDDQPITKSIIGMAHLLGLDVVAEGIETEEQKQFLTDEKCEFGQGFLYSQPLRIEEFIKLF